MGKLDDYLRVNEMAIGLRERRAGVLASNIANADTPNFKARDIDFKAALQNALDAKSTTANALTKTDPAHLDGNAGNAAADGTPILYRVPTQPSADGNTVDMDVERNQFADNAVRYEAGLSFITSQIKDMLSVIQN
ncbi:MAG: flagellar basal body rod protein FlgB [Burkholderiaceae bacterium]|nr:flagellar basal body rod protein FlgB [Burkholderiaceae bacterium]